MKPNIVISKKIMTALAAVIVLFSSCKKYLEPRSNKSLLIPTTIKELQSLMDHPKMYSEYPAGGEISDDNSYFNTTTFQSVFFKWDRDAYLWDANTDLSQDWGLAYTRIFNTNVVLDALTKINDANSTQLEYNNVKGTALFYRAYNNYELAQLFSPQYSQNTSSGFGIPLKTSPNIDEVTTRSTLQETYNQIINDLKGAAPLLPVSSIYKNRPTKTAAFGLLARTFLVMGDFNNSLKYSDSCLSLYSILIDYNTVDSTQQVPFLVFNNEVLFHSASRDGNFVFRFQSVDTLLYASYDNNDLRKPIFYSNNGNNTFSFKGNYNGTTNFILFSGIATDEMYLTKAESWARLNQKDSSMNILNQLMVKRWKNNGTFIPFTAVDPADALSKILKERRKELAFRPSLRWSDLRRLNPDNNYAVTLKRIINSQTYTLPPNDLRYTFLIPISVIQISGVQQNPR